MAGIVRKTGPEMLRQRITQDYLAQAGIRKEEPPQRPPIRRQDPLHEPPQGSRKESPVVTSKMIEEYTVDVRNNPKNLGFIDSIIKNPDWAILVQIVGGSVNRAWSEPRSNAENKKAEIEKDGTKGVVILEGSHERIFKERITELRLDDFCSRVERFARDENIADYCQFLSDNLGIVQNSETLLRTIEQNMDGFLAIASNDQLKKMVIRRPGEAITGQEIDFLIFTINQKISREEESRASEEQEREKIPVKPKSKGLKPAILLVAILALVLAFVVGLLKQPNRSQSVDEPSPPAATVSVSPSEETPLPVPTRPRITTSPTETVEETPAPVEAPTETPGGRNNTINRNGLDGISGMIADELDSAGGNAAQRIIKYLNDLSPKKRNDELRRLWDIKEQKGSWDAAAATLRD